MKKVNVRLLGAGAYLFSDDVQFPFVVEGSLDVGRVIILGFELHKIDPNRFDDDGFEYYFNDYRGNFEVLS